MPFPTYPQVQNAMDPLEAITALHTTNKIFNSPVADPLKLFFLR